MEIDTGKYFTEYFWKILSGKISSVHLFTENEKKKSNYNFYD